MKILITGALGHIGSKFIHSVRRSDFEEIRLVDNLSTQRYVSMFNLPEDVKFSFFECDIRDRVFESLVIGVDAVVHLAAITDAESSVKDPDSVSDVNLKATIKIAEICASNNIKLFFPSTTSVYGSQDNIVTEQCLRTDLAPQSPYAESKLLAEEYLIEQRAKQRLNCVIYRMGTIFGISKGMRFHTAVNKFCWQAAFNYPLTVWSSAVNQKRPYLGIDDAVSAIQIFLKRDQFKFPIYNVVSENYSLSDIINQIKMKKPELTIELVNSPIMNQLSYEVSNKLFVSEGFEFKDNVYSGITDTLLMLGV